MNNVEMSVISGYVQANSDYAACRDDYLIIDKYVKDGDDVYWIKYCFELYKITVVITKEKSLVNCIDAATFVTNTDGYIEHGNVVDWIVRVINTAGKF